MRCPLEVLSQVQPGRRGRAVSLSLPAFAGGHVAVRRLAAVGHFGRHVLAAAQVSRPGVPYFEVTLAAGQVAVSCQRLLLLAGFGCMRLARMAKPQGTPNPSLKRSAIGRAPGPRGLRVYRRPRGPGTLPLSPA